MIHMSYSMQYINSKKLSDNVETKWLPALFLTTSTLNEAMSKDARNNKVPNADNIS